MAKGYVGVNTFQYTPLDYIESTGTQYIDTGVVPKSTTRMIYDFANTDNSVNNRAGWGSTSSAEAFFVGSVTSKSVFYASVSSNWAGADTTTSLDTNRHIFDVSNSALTFDGVSFGTGDIGDTATSGQTIYLMAIHTEYSPYIQYAKQRLYSCQIYDGTTLIRDFIPVLSPNNVVCLYEQVEGTFYYNLGSGTFTAGGSGAPLYREVARKLKQGYVGIPASYTPVEYLESSGTQHIGTGVTFNNVKVEIQFAATNATQSGVGVVGAYANSVGAILFGFNSNKFQFAYGGPWNGSTLAMDTNTHIAKLNVENKCTLDSTTLATSSNITTSLNSGLEGFLFTSNGGAGKSSARIYYCKIWDSNDTLIREFIPTIDNNNVACMYDKVEGKAYYNKGTGTFTTGNATGEPVINVVVARKIFKGYVGVSGVAKLCFGASVPQYRTTLTNTIHKNGAAVSRTDSYILVCGGQTTDAATPVKTVTAYPSSLVSVQAADLPIQLSWQAAGYINGYGVVASGKTANSGSSNTNRTFAYTDNLTVQELSGIYGGRFEAACAANETHLMVGGGSNYSSNQSSIDSYSTSLVKTHLSNMSCARRNGNMGANSDYIICCGGFDTYGAVDFYDNSNVKTTASDPYNKRADNPLPLTTDSYVIFFGGSTNQNNTSYNFSDCKAFDKNKVLHSFYLPAAVSGAQGLSNGKYALAGYSTTGYVYDDNLVLTATEESATSIFGRSLVKCGEKLDTFGIIHKDWTTDIQVFDV